MSYTHFSASERSQLYKLGITDKLSQSAIAAMMKRSKSTISRELSRNSSEVHKVYLPDIASIDGKKSQSKIEGKIQKGQCYNNLRK